MATKNFVLGLVGSPNREGRTNQLVKAALEGAAQTDVATELVQMADHVVAACRDCLPWVCQTHLKCTYEDDAFEHLSAKVLNCGALILGTPVYWWDTTGMMRYFILKMFRIYARSAPLAGLPAFGISIAGGTGNGLVAGLRPVYHFFQMMQMRAQEPLPVTRFNFDEGLRRARKLGGQLGKLSGQRLSFANLEERLLWYDGLSYLGLSRAAERRLLAGFAASTLPEDVDPSVPSGLGRADTLSAAGRSLESLIEITRVYEASVKLFEKK